MKKTVTLLLAAIIINIGYAQQTRIEIVKDTTKRSKFMQLPGGYANGIKTINGKAFIHMDKDNNIGGELYITDGTVKGTKLVKDIQPGIYKSGLDKFNFDYNSYVFNNKIYFAADSNNTGKELWQSDGTKNGTRLVKEIRTGKGATDPRSYVAFNNKLYFSAQVTSNTNHLYRTDGTTTGTKVFNTDISEAHHPMVFNQKLYYGCYYHKTRKYSLISIDTNNNIKSYHGTTGFTYANPKGLIKADSFLFWVAEDFSNGMEPRVTNWNDSSFLLMDINPRKNWGMMLNSNESNIASTGKYIYFQANDGGKNSQLWRTDGTTAGTKKIKEIGTSNAHFLEMVTMDGKIYFVATDQVNGYEIWVSDGTSAGTKIVKKIIPGNNSISSKPTNFFVMGKKIYFQARSLKLTANTLWQTDGTANGTKEVISNTSLYNPNTVDNFFTLNNKLYFSAYNKKDGYELHTLTEFFNISLGKDTTACEKVILKPTTNAKTYLWSTNETTATIKVTKTGTYWLEAKDANGKVGRDTIKVTINPLPKPKITGNLIACGETTISADKNYSTYKWSTGQTTKSIKVDTTTNLLFLDVTNSFGCKGQDVQYVTIDTIPNISLGNDIKACAVTTINIDTLYKVKWNDNDSINKRKFTKTGIYWATMSNSKGCKVTDTISITINPFPNINFLVDTSACDSIKLAVNKDYKTTVWNSTDNSYYHWYKESGENSASIYVIDTNGCSASAAWYVTIEKTPLFALKDTSLCGKDSIILKSPYPTYNNIWNGISTTNITIKSSGKQTLIISSKKLGCTHTDSNNVVLSQPPVFNLQDTFKGCDSVIVDAGNYHSYHWSDNTSKRTNTYKDLDKTWVTVFNKDGCATSDTFNVVINYKPNSKFVVNHSTGNTQFIALNNALIDTYFWKFGDGNSSTKKQPYNTYDSSISHTVMFVATNQCGSDTSYNTSVCPYGKTVGITSISSPSIAVYPNPTSALVYIELPISSGKYSIRILNTMGQLILKDNNKSGKIKVDLSTFNKGNYILLLTDNNNMSHSVRIAKY